ncbi:uncharacterized protein K452DRAFT_357029 [Aplosporella prunicola CBS 121167]|uniref:Uncharacterized protein n=1 Tax=Aplosporella prunicola CBS 121167 TaxID=1176127 RepID=A0A6A6BJ98_9PEZI|nr:uncharacterized protein K452DRAFT_357029 [Aplosporella prunicola CBS 121167]KAF2144096.1 hypothetical protein K452DRAFT_357029 [Aplosporella prunicola CBS 121167]
MYNCYSPSKRGAKSPVKHTNATLPQDSTDSTDSTDMLTQTSPGGNAPREFRISQTQLYRDIREIQAQVSSSESSPMPTVVGDNVRGVAASSHQHNDSVSTSEAPSTTITMFLDPDHQHRDRRRGRSPSDSFDELQLVPEGAYDAVPTERAWVENRSERKIMKMMSNTDRTPPITSTFGYDSDDDTPTQPTRVYYTNNAKPAKKSSKILRGLNINMRSLRSVHPFSTAFSDESTILSTNVSSAASKAISASLSAKNPFKSSRRHQRAESAPSVSQAPGSSPSTLTALPQLNNKQTETGRKDQPTTLQTSPNSDGANGEARQPRERRRRRRHASVSTRRPTPPEKDTPPHVRKAREDEARLAAQIALSGLQNRADEVEDANSIDYNQDSAYIRHGAEVYMDLIQKVPSVYSMRARVESKADAQELLLREKGSPVASRSRKSGSSSGRGLLPGGLLPATVYRPEVPPTYFYSPSMYSVASPNMGKRGNSVSVYITRQAPPPFSSSPPDIANNTLGDRPSFPPRSSSLAPKNMRSESVRPGFDRAATHKPAADNASVVNAELHSADTNNRNSVNGAKSSQSIGLAPMLAQQTEEAAIFSMSPVAHHPSAMPSPLRASFSSPPPQPMMALPGLPPDHELLTHFHVLHFHIDEIMRGIQIDSASTKSEVLADGAAKYDELRKLMNENFGNLVNHLNALEHKMGRSTNELDAVKKEITTISNNMDEHYAKPMKKLLNQVSELTKHIELLQERTQKLEKKLDDDTKRSSTSVHGLSNDNATPTAQSSGEAAFNRAQAHIMGTQAPYRWSGYEGARHVLQSGPQDRPAQFGETGGFFNPPESSQRQSYHDNSFYGNGNGSYNYLSLTDGTERDNGSAISGRVSYGQTLPNPVLTALANALGSLADPLRNNSSANLSTAANASDHEGSLQEEKEKDLIAVNEEDASTKSEPDVMQVVALPALARSLP